MNDVDDLVNYRRIRKLCRKPLAYVLNLHERVIYTTSRLGRKHSERSIFNEAKRVGEM